MVYTVSSTKPSLQKETPFQNKQTLKQNRTNYLPTPNQSKKKKIKQNPFNWIEDMAK